MGQRVLFDAKLGSEPRDDGPFKVEPIATRYHVALKIEQLTLKLCVAWNGIGAKPKGKGSVTIDVTVLDSVRHVRLPDKEMVINLDLQGRDPRRDENVLADAIKQVMHQFVLDHAAPG